MSAAAPPVPNPPSLALRALVALLLLAGFYVTIFGLALVLLAAPVLALVTGVLRLGYQELMLVVVCWVPAAVLIGGAVSARPPPFVAPGRALTQAEAPGLFAMVAELAAASGARPPSRIYLVRDVNAAVVEHGGFLGVSAERVMLIGLPLLEMLTVAELRAVIAHELGHFLGGDTRLGGVASYTVALFRSVLETGERSPFRQGTQHFAVEMGLGLAESLTRAVVGQYAKVFFFLTGALSRQQEVAADAWSVRLAGADAAASALRKSDELGPLFSAYLRGDVAFAVRSGALPTDLFAGFDAFRARFPETDAGARFVASLRAQPADPYDSHPPLEARLRALAGFSGETGGAGAAAESGVDGAPATSVLADLAACRAWLGDEVLAAVNPPRPARPMPWSDVADGAYAPAVREAARVHCARLHASFPGVTTVAEMLATVVSATASGQAPSLALAVEPRLQHVEPWQRAEAVHDVMTGLLGVLFQGALLERGARVQPSLGEPGLVFDLAGEELRPLELVCPALAESRFDALSRWAERLQRAPRPEA